MHIPACDDSFIEKYENDEYEPEYFRSLSEHVDGLSDPVYYDIGSRWGICISAAMEMGISPENIHGFEAHPIAYRALTSNHGDSAVKLTKSTVSESTDERRIAIDDYVRSHASPSIVKIDVEGAELQVLQGMESLVETESPILYVEVHPGLLREYGESQRRVVDYLTRHGYSIEKAEDHRSESHWTPITDVKQLPVDGDYMLRAE